MSWPRWSRAATTPTARARRTAAAGTATSTRISGHCSASRSPDKYKTKFCGLGDLATCRASLWQALKDAGDELAAAQGTNDPSQWRKSAIPERIAFPPVPASGPGSVSMRWTNRPTYQQVISYDGHR